MSLLITGIGKGFGRYYLEHLVDNFDLNIYAVTRTLSDFSANEIKHLDKRNVKLIELDLSDITRVENFISSNQELFSEITVLINNAGQRYRRSIEEIKAAELEELFRVNVIAPFILAKACVPGMKLRKRGKIINISSILGKSGLEFLSGYSATKGAIDSMTRSLSVELAPYSVQVNAIAPGFCKTSYYQNFKENEQLHYEITNKIPSGRWGEPDELNGLLDFLIFGESAYITGQVLYVDGGWTAK